MEIVDSLGQARLTLEGAGRLQAEGQDSVSVAFHLTQTTDGRVLLGTSSANNFYGVDKPVRFDGVTARSPYWQVKIEQGFWLTGNAIIDKDGSADESVFACSTALLRLHDANERGAHLVRAGTPTQATVALVNYPGQRTETLVCLGMPMTIEPVPQSELSADARRLIGGVSHTHDLHVSRVDSLEGVSKAMQIVQLALILQSGSLVNFYEIGLSSETRDIERELRTPQVRARASHPFGTRGTFNLQLLIDAIEGLQNLDQLDELAAMYAESNNHETFMEARALNAISLIETLVQHYEHETPSSVALTKQQRRDVRRAARDAADQAITALGLDQSDAEMIKQNVDGNLARLTDSTFRQKLSTHLGRMEIVRDTFDRDKVIGAAVNSRNLLVHTGTFAGSTVSEHRLELHRLLWIALALLSRRAGYLGGFDVLPSSLA